MKFTDDFYLNGQAYGTMAQRLAATMDPGRDRPYWARDRKTGRMGKFITVLERDGDGSPIWERDPKTGELIALESFKNGYVRRKPKTRTIEAPTANALLTYDQWKEIDREVLGIYHLRTPGIQDMLSRGLRYDLPNALGTTVLQWQTGSGLDNAFMDMDAQTMGDFDRIKFETKYLPVPIIHQPFKLSIRELSMNVTQGAPLDVSHAREAMITVAERAENVFFNGSSAYTFGGGTIRGLTDYPDRNLVTMGTSWATDTGANIITDVINMRQALINDRRYGPYGLYVSTNIDSNLENDYNSTYPSDTIRQRIMRIGGEDTSQGKIEFVHTADKLTASNAVMVDLSRETIEIVVGFEPRTIQWQENGGMVTIYKVMAIMVPRIKSDQDGRCGIAHCS